jgi:hypothetical protein
MTRFSSPCLPVAVLKTPRVPTQLCGGVLLPVPVRLGNNLATRRRSRWADFSTTQSALTRAVREYRDAKGCRLAIQRIFSHLL